MQALFTRGLLVVLIAATFVSLIIYAALGRLNSRQARSPAQMLLQLPQSASALAFGPDGHLLATGGPDGAVNVWETATGQRTLALSTDGRVEALAFSPDGKWLAAVSADQGTYLWELSTGRLVTQVAHPGNLGHVAFSPNSAWLVSGGFGTPAHIVNLTSGQAIDQLAVKYGMNSIAFSPDSRWLAVLSTGSYRPGAVQVWDMATRQQAMLIDLPYITYPALAFSPDGKWLAANSGGLDGSPVALWETGSWREIVRLRHAESADGPVSGLAISGDGALIATSSLHSIHIWEAGTWREISRLPHTDAIFTMAFSPDGRWIVAGTGQGTPPDTLFNGAWVWDARTGQLVAQLPHDAQVTLLAFSPNGQWLASAGASNMVRIWRW
jgi:WD40 repeat protein